MSFIHNSSAGDGRRSADILGSATPSTLTSIAISNDGRASSASASRGLRLVAAVEVVIEVPSRRLGDGLVVRHDDLAVENRGVDQPEVASLVRRGEELTATA